jgi:hypothetical protein
LPAHPAQEVAHVLARDCFAGTGFAGAAFGFFQRIEAGHFGLNALELLAQGRVFLSLDDGFRTGVGPQFGAI